MVCVSPQDDGSGLIQRDSDCRRSSGLRRLSNTDCSATQRCCTVAVNTGAWKKQTFGWDDMVMLIWTHHGCRGRLDLVAAFLCAVDGTVTDVFRGYQMKFLNVMQNFALFQTFILRVVSSFAGFAWRRYHRVLLSWHEPCHLRMLKEPGTR